MEINSENQSKLKNYFYNIDFYRFILIMAVTLFHTRHLLKGYDIPLFKHILENVKFSCIAVEMFFVISGFFLFYTMNLHQNFYQFAKQKFLRLMPVLLFSLTLFYIISWFTPLKITKYNNIWALFLLQNIGITKDLSTIGVDWYVSCLFWVSCIFFYLYKHLKKEYFNVIIVFTVVFCCAYLTNNKLTIPSLNYDTFLNGGMLRALSSMGIGYLIWNFYCDVLIKIKDSVLNIWQKLIITALEAYLSVFIIKNILFKCMSYSNHLLLVFLFSILFILLIIKQGYISKLLDNKFSKFIGKYTYSIFLTHPVCLCLFRFYSPEHKNFIINHPSIYLSIVFISYITLGVLTYYFVEKPASDYLKRHRFNNELLNNKAD